MEPKAPAYISITSYELSGDRANPILTHTFWGQDINQALAYARSHMVSDAFFSSTFTGSMEWNSGELLLDYSIDDTKGLVSYRTEEELQCILNYLLRNASDINNKQRNIGMIRSIAMVNNQVKGAPAEC